MINIIELDEDKTRKSMDKRFIINDIICVSYSEIKDIENPFPQKYTILFALHQDLFDKYEYIQLIITADTKMDIVNLRKSGMFIDDLMKDEENSQNIKAICQHLTYNTLYSTDFKFSYDEDKNVYLIKGIRQTGKNIYEERVYQLDMFSHLRIAMFKDILKYKSIINPDTFTDKIFNSVEYMPVDTVKLDGTCKVVNKDTYFYISHYTFKCGPSSRGASYTMASVGSEVKFALREPMTFDQYTAQYGKDPSISTILYNDIKDEVWAIIPCDLNTTKEKLIVIKLKREFYEKTNFRDPSHYIFYNKITVNNSGGDILPPHIKF